MNDTEVYLMRTEFSELVRLVSEECGASKPPTPRIDLCVLCRTKAGRLQR